MSTPTVYLQRFARMIFSRKFFGALVPTLLILWLRFAGQIDDVSGVTLLGFLTGIWTTFIGSQAVVDFKAASTPSVL